MPVKAATCHSHQTLVPGPHRVFRGGATRSGLSPLYEVTQLQWVAGTRRARLGKTETTPTYRQDVELLPAQDVTNYLLNEPPGF